MATLLPNGWTKARLGEACVPVTSSHPGGFPDVEYTYFDIGCIDNERNSITEPKRFIGRMAPSRARQVVRKNDILFSTVRTYLRNIARVEHDYANPIASTGFAVIRAGEGVSSDFLFFQLLSDSFIQPLNALQSGSSYPAVRPRDVFMQEILLAPTREQKRIAEKLNEALAALERAKAASPRAQERL